MGFVLRWVAAFVLLAATYNPTDWSYTRWATANWGSQMPLAVLFGLILLIVYVVFFTAVLRGIGALGVILVAAVFAALVWVLVDLGWIDFDNRSSVTWLALIGLSLVLAVGLYWGILWRRISGQIEVDDEAE